MKDKPDRTMVRELALFRYALLSFLRFSERAARACGVTPRQRQLMLGVAGFTAPGVATISELAEFLQEWNNSVTGLVERAAERGFIHTAVVVRRRGQISLSRQEKADDSCQACIRGGQ